MKTERGDSERVRALKQEIKALKQQIEYDLCEYCQAPLDGYKSSPYEGLCGECEIRDYNETRCWSLY